MSDDNSSKRRGLALEYHARSPAGKIEVIPTKPCTSQRDLSLAYTPGVAVPCLEIEKDPSTASLYTIRGNLVGVITNGTAVLGLGNIGPLASKPVMEGKAVLFKRFAGIDVFDLEVDCSDPDRFIDIVKSLEPTFGGINLEDIKAPECFYIEKELREQMNIPVFHDDQHGTAIIAAAALMNATEIAGKSLTECRIVFSGAGAAATACGRLLMSFGVPQPNIMFCDKYGVVFKGRETGDYDQEDIAVDTGCRTLSDAMVDADIFIGLSVGGVVNQDMVRSMGPSPIIFALANPTPEIDYAKAREARDDALIATGRSDYPNQVNNVLGFPYIFRGALDCGATGITTEMELAAARAIAALAKEDVPDSVRDAYGETELRFGPDYFIPKPFDHRVLLWVAPAVAGAAAESGVATEPIEDLEAYQEFLTGFLGKRREVMAHISTVAKDTPKRIVFPEGTEPRILRACHELAHARICAPIVLGDIATVHRVAREAGVSLEGIEIISPTESPRYEAYREEYYALRQRRGITRRTATQALLDPIFFGMLMLQQGDTDGLVAGMSMNYQDTIRPALRIIGLQPTTQVTAGMYMILQRNRTVFFADTTVNIEPDARTLAQIALLTAEEVKNLGWEPRVAMVSFSNFGSSSHPLALKVRQATRMVRDINPDLIVDGEMQIDPALDRGLAEEEFPFSDILGDANILVFPSLESANVAYKLMTKLGEAEAIGPILLGMHKPVNVLPRGCSSEDAFNMAAYTVVQSRNPRAP